MSSTASISAAAAASLSSKDSNVFEIGRDDEFEEFEDGTEKKKKKKNKFIFLLSLIFGIIDLGWDAKDGSADEEMDVGDVKQWEDDWDSDDLTDDFSVQLRAVLDRVAAGN
jgi:hypothetical protein